MLRFYVFDQDTRPEWSLEEAFLVGKGDAVLSGQPLWKNGVIECASSHRETYGLAIRWRVGDSVNYLLQTYFAEALYSKCKNNPLFLQSLH